MRYRKRPVVVDAMLWMGGDYSELSEFCGRNWARADTQEMSYDDPEKVVVWNTASGQWLQVPVGQWIIRGTEGELYPCKASIFDENYEKLVKAAP